MLLWSQKLMTLKIKILTINFGYTIKALNWNACHKFLNILYSSNSEYWPQTSQQNDSIHSTILDVHVLIHILFCSTTQENEKRVGSHCLPK